MKEVRRVFLGWDRPSLGLACDWLLETYGCHLQDVTIALPGRRAGRRLMELLSEAAPVDWTPPRFLTLAQLSDELTAWPFPRAGDPLRTLSWIAALQGLSAKELSTLLPKPPRSRELEEWWPAAELLRSLHAELSAENLHFADVAAVVIEEDRARWRTLSRLQESFTGILEQAGFGDPHWMRLQALAAEQFEELPGPLVLLGLPEANRLHRLLLGKVSSPVTALVAAPADLADAFDGFGFLHAEAWAERPLSIAEDRIHACRDGAHQAEELLGALERGCSELAAEDVTLGILEEQRFPEIEAAFGARGVELHLPVGLPGARTPIALLLDALATWCARPQIAELGAVLRHPDLERCLAEETGHAVDAVAVDAYYEEHLPIDAGPDWLETSSDKDSKRAQHADLRRQSGVLWGLTEGLRGKPQQASAWAPVLRWLLEKVYGTRELDRSREGDRVLASALETCLKILLEWEGLPQAGDTAFRLTGSAALRLLLRDLVASEVPPGGRAAAAVDAVGWLELPLDDAPALLLTDFQEGLVPAALGGHPLLDLGLRSKLGMAGEEERWARDRYLLEWILKTREGSGWPRFFLCRTGADGNPKQPSRFLFLGEGSEVVQRAKVLFHEVTAPSGIARVPLPGPAVWPGPREDLEYQKEVFSPSRLNGYLNSPYQYYLEQVLGLREVDDRARELDPLQYGILLHAALERFGRDPELRDLEEAGAIATAVSGFLRDVSLERFGARPRPLVELQLQQAEERITQFARLQAVRRAEGWSIHEVEWNAPGDEVPAEMGETRFRLRGQVDRIDRREVDGRVEWCILDYKTGDKKKVSGDFYMPRAKRWMDVQLGLYPLLCRGLTGGRGLALDGGAVSAAYWNLGASSENHGLTAIKMDQEMADELETQVVAAVEGIRAGRFFHEGQPTRHRSAFTMRCMGDNLLALAEEAAAAEGEL